MSLTRKSTYVIFILIGFLITVLTAISFINFSFMGEKLSQQIYEYSHYKPTITGGIYWSFFPRPHIKLQNVVIENNPSHSNPLAKADLIQLYPEILPLFSGHFKLQSIAINELAVRNLLLKNAQTTINAKNNLVLLDPFTANIYEGDYQGQILIDTNNRNPKITFNGYLKKANASLLLKSVTNKSNVPFSGNLNAEIAINFIPEESKQITWHNFNGTTKITIENGILQGINIPALIQCGCDIIEQRKLPTISHVNQTHFDSLHGSFQIHNGVLFNQDLTIRASELNVTGHGEIDVPRETMDYSLNASLTNHKGTTPIRIQGHFSNLQISTQLGQINQKTLTQTVEHLKEKLKDKLKQLHLETLLS